MLFILVIISILCCQRLDGCQSVEFFPKIPLEHPGRNSIFIHDKHLLLQDGDKIHMIDTKNLTKKGQISRESLYKFIEPPLNTSSFCKKSCNYKCVHESNEQLKLCGFTAILPGCPLMPKEYHQKNNINKCTEQVPFLFLVGQMANSKNILIGLPLECRSSQWLNLKKPLEQLNYLVSSFDPALTATKFVALISTSIVKGHTIYGICEFSQNEIVKRLNDEMALINIKSKGNEWKQVSKNEFTSAPDLFEGFISNYEQKRAILNFEFLKNEIITNYEMAHTTSFDFHFLSTSKGKILKGITGSLVNTTYDLYCDIEGITQMKIYNEQTLYVLTRRYLYALPLHSCNSSKTCMKCVRDPQCVWNDDQRTCGGYKDLKQIKFEKNARQTIKNENLEKICSDPTSDPNAKIQEVIAKEIEDLLSKKFAGHEIRVEKIVKNGIEILEERITKNLSKQLDTYKQTIALQDQEIHDLKNENNRLKNPQPQISHVDQSSWYQILIYASILIILSLLICWLIRHYRTIKKNHHDYTFIDFIKSTQLKTISIGSNQNDSIQEADSARSSLSHTLERPTQNRGNFPNNQLYHPDVPLLTSTNFQNGYNVNNNNSSEQAMENRNPSVRIIA